MLVSLINYCCFLDVPEHVFHLLKYVILSFNYGAWPISGTQLSNVLVYLSCSVSTENELLSCLLEFSEVTGSILFFFLVVLSDQNLLTVATFFGFLVHMIHL